MVSTIKKKITIWSERQPKKEAPSEEPGSSFITTAHQSAEITGAQSSTESTTVFHRNLVIKKIIKKFYFKMSWRSRLMSVMSSDQNSVWAIQNNKSEHTSLPLTERNVCVFKVLEAAMKLNSSVCVSFSCTISSVAKPWNPKSWCGHMTDFTLVFIPEFDPLSCKKKKKSTQ